MVALVARRPFPFAGRSIAAGECFDASVADAHVLTLGGYAVASEPEPMPEPEPDPVPDPTLPPVRKRGRPRKQPV